MSTKTKTTPLPQTICIVFDGPPGSVAGRFVEVEDSDGHGLGVGEWSERPDGLWVLTIETGVPDMLAALEECADWMCEAHEGSDQWERGQVVRAAIAKAKATS